MSVFDLPAEGFNRRQPRFRLFRMEDGSQEWWSVVPELNAPGQRCSDVTSVWLTQHVNEAPWGHLFWAAFHATGKATIYETV